MKPPRSPGIHWSDLVRHRRCHFLSKLPDLRSQMNSYSKFEAGASSRWPNTLTRR
jgi:hypothetical protein